MLIKMDLTVSTFVMATLGLSCSAQTCDSLTNSSSPSDLIACIMELESRVSEQLPDGAVIAFDRPQGCPVGWEDVGEKWRGKTFVAAVGNANDAYGFGRSGGSEVHVLTLDELPQHNHKLDHGGTNAAINANAGTDWGVRQTNGPVNTHAVGGGRPHNNMPPYVALYMCKKS